MPSESVDFDYRIETKQLRFGRWIYIIHLSESRSQPSRKFATEQAALEEAHELLSYML